MRQCQDDIRQGVEVMVEVMVLGNGLCRKMTVDPRGGFGQLQFPEVYGWWKVEIEKLKSSVSSFVKDQIQPSE